MENNPRRILIAATSDSDAAVMQQLECAAQKNHVQIQIFDNTVFNTDKIPDSEKKSSLADSNSSNNKRQLKTPIFSIDLGEQIGTSLIGDTDLHSNTDHPEGESINLPFHENIHKNQILWYSFQEYLLHNEIDSVVFLTAPQGLNELLLYQTSKALKLYVLILCQSPVSSRFFSYCAIPDCGNYDKSAETPAEIWQSIEDVAANRTHRQTPINCQSSNSSGIRQIIGFLLKNRPLKLLNPSYVLGRAKHLHDAPANIADWKDPFAKFFYCQSTAYFDFFASDQTSNIDLNQKFVYFPIQSLAELHTEILNNVFGDQLLALEHLACMLPQDCAIFIKSDQYQESDFLTPMFFHRIRRIGNVVRLPSCFDGNLLVDHSEFIATVNSPIGWEALLRGKNVLVFGKPWYRKLPGAYEYCSELEYLDITQSEIDKLELLHEINHLFSRSEIGRLVLEDGSDAVDTDIDENAEQAASSIFDCLLGRKKPTFQAEST